MLQMTRICVRFWMINAAHKNVSTMCHTLTQHMQRVYQCWMRQSEQHNSSRSAYCIISMSTTCARSQDKQTCSQSDRAFWFACGSCWSIYTLHVLYFAAELHTYENVRSPSHRAPGAQLAGRSWIATQRASVGLHLFLVQNECAGSCRVISKRELHDVVSVAWVFTCWQAWANFISIHTKSFRLVYRICIIMYIASRCVTVCPIDYLYVYR